MNLNLMKFKHFEHLSPPYIVNNNYVCTFKIDEIMRYYIETQNLINYNLK